MKSIVFARLRATVVLATDVHGDRRTEVAITCCRWQPMLAPRFTVVCLWPARCASSGTIRHPLQPRTGATDRHFTWITDYTGKQRARASPPAEPPRTPCLPRISYAAGSAQSGEARHV